MFKGIRINYCIVAVLSSAFLAFGLYHVHSLSGVTEGGVIGLNLLLDHWFHISPSITNFIANVICYALGWKLLGRKFIIYSAVATVSFSVSYSIMAATRQRTFTGFDYRCGICRYWRRALC